MALSMYQASVPVFLRALGNLSTILHKAEAHAAAKKIDPSVFVNARLAPDMLSLAGQVQRASDTSKGAAGRLAGIELPRFEDTETTFADLQARIAKTVTFLQGVPAEKVDGSEEREVKLSLRNEDVVFRGQDYLLGFALPNFFFHVTTAYAILRHNGVDIGKRDFLGTP